MPPSGSRSGTGSASVSGRGSRASSSSARNVKAKDAAAVLAISALGDKVDDGAKIKARSIVSSTAKASANGLPATPSRTARARKSTAHGLSSLRSTTSIPPPSAQSHGISLSPSSHSRTDPLSALSTLLKLIRSLPNRIGGCAYKFTPAEHALAIHLVGVLDPYVFRGYRASTLASTASVEGVDSIASPLLLQQPTEILDAVLSHLDSRKDVLNFGLACKRLWEVVSPRHLEYRVVKAKPSNVAVWAHLVRNKDLARNVRRLEILDERMVLGSSSTTGVHSGAAVHIPRTLLLSRDTDHDSTDDELALHVKYQKYLAAALSRMTALKHFKWGTGKASSGGVRLSDIWQLLSRHRGGVMGGLTELAVEDNFLFHPLLADEESTDDATDGDGSDDGSGEEYVASAGVPKKGNIRRVKSQPANLFKMQTIVFRSTAQAYGAAKLPELGRINMILHRCVNLKNLEITYVSPRSPSSAGATAGPAPVFPLTAQRPRPLTDDLFLYTRLPHLTHLTLGNLRCTSAEAASSFLGAHKALEVLHFEVAIHGALILPTGSLPLLREVKASKELINAILECPLSVDKSRPLEIVKGFKLSGSALSPSPSAVQGHSTRTVPDSRFLSNLRSQGSTVRRIEMIGWHDMDDVKRIVGSVSGLTWLDVGRKLGGAMGGPVANLTEWTEVLSTLPELVAVHGVRFFYEVSTAAMGCDDLNYATPHATCSTSSTTIAPTSHATNAIQHNNLSMMERSRMRKNDEIAGVLAWKCKKLRRVDHWESNEDSGAPGKVVVLLREGKEVRWEVRRVRV